MSEEQVAEAPAEAGQAPSVESTATEFNFRDHIDETLRDDPSLASYKDINGMAKSLINAQKMVGADKVAIPGSWGTEADWDQVYDKLGRPGEPSAYELDGGEDAVEDNINWFKEVAYKIGLNQNQAQAMLQEYNERMGSQTAVTEEQLEANRTRLETELRADLGDQFEPTLRQANSVLNEFEASELTELQLADGSLLGDNPEVIQLFANIGAFMHERLAEDSFSGRESEPGLTSGDIAKKLSDITAPGSPYWDKTHPDHDRSVAEALRLRGL